MADAISHNKKYVFSTYNLLNIIYDNWWFLYEPFRIKDAVSVLEKITNDKDIQALRNAGACSFIEIRGKVYCLDMMATSGHSAFDVALANRVCNTIRKNEDILKDRKIEKIFLTGYHKPCFGVVCKDQSSGILIPLILGK